MACIHYEILLDVSADKAWAALRDVGSAHRLFAGVLTDGRLDGDIRTVTFANGLVARERIIDVDESHRRVAYAVIDNMFEHHSASMQILPAGEGRCRFVWITDLLPDERAAMVRPLVEQGCTAMKRVLEGA
ncbi:MAG TPA: SRPBCC family protein [Xanthobacteraceae bacterium]